MIAAIIAFNYPVNFVILSSESCLLAFVYFLLDSIDACMMMNCSSELFSIFLFHLDILKLKVGIEVSYK